MKATIDANEPKKAKHEEPKLGADAKRTRSGAQLRSGVRAGLAYSMGDVDN